MTAETAGETPIVDTSDDLDAFSATFYGTSMEAPKDDPKPEDESKDAPEDVSDDTPPAPDKEAEDDDPVDPEDNAEADKPKPKKKSAQERISELANARREAERRAEELERKLQEALGKKDTPKEEAVAKVSGEPTPDDLGEDGEPKYPLGEFDPNYIRDLTKFTLNEEKKAADAARESERKAAQEQEVREHLMNDWQNRIEDIENELPDFRTKAASLEDTFSDIDPKYGEFLATTIMSLEAGPRVLYHLAENPDEAEAIVKMGPVMAAVALGRLEASLATKVVIPPKTSDAPPPPPRNRGGSVRMTTPGDTDDLDAFEKEFFKKK